MTIASNDDHHRTSNEVFEYWSNLAKTDPARFEKERAARIEKAIKSASPKNQQRLRQLQWVIDGERQKAKNPLDATIRLSNMMWERFYADDGFLFAINQLS